LAADALGSLVQHADVLGFDTIWLPDHLVNPVEVRTRYPYTFSGERRYHVETPLNDVWVVIGHAAALTQRIRLGTGVYILPLRNPFVTARAAMTAHALSGGRVVLGVGAGWLREEFSVVGEAFATRGTRMDEILTILTLLWSGERVAHAGAHYRFSPVYFGPAPLKPIPIFIGGLGEAALRRAAKFGDGWYGPDCSLEVALGARNRIEGLRASEGKAHRHFEYIARLHEGMSRQVLRRYADAGFDHVAVSLRSLLEVLPDVSLGQVMSAMSRVAEELLNTA